MLREIFVLVYDVERSFKGAFSSMEDLVMYLDSQGFEIVDDEDYGEIVRSKIKTDWITGYHIIRTTINALNR